jgi:hypothetical protein
MKLIYIQQDINIQFVHHREKSMGSFIRTNPSILCGEVIELYFGKHMKPTNTPCGQNSESQMLNFVVYTVNTILR